jgi:hypothetical protein
MRPDSRRRLEAFVARVTQLERYSFFDGGENIAGTTVRYVNDTPMIESHGPSDEAIDAVLFHIRVLTQRDDISIGRLAELYDDSTISQAWRDEHLKWRTILNSRLNDVYAEGPGGQQLTYGQALEMELHGNRGHYKSTDRAYRLHEAWVRTDFERQMTRDVLNQLIIWIAAIAHNIAAASREELARAQ